jgi:hypothetical protein
VRINHKFIKDEALISQQRRELEDLERKALPLLRAVRDAAASP